MAMYGLHMGKSEKFKLTNGKHSETHLLVDRDSINK